MANPRIEPLKKVLAIDPNDEVAWFGLGKAYMDDGNFVEAVTALESCIRVKPTSPLPTMRWLNLSRSSIGSTVAVRSSIRASPSQLRMEMRWSLKIWNCSSRLSPNHSTPAGRFPSSIQRLIILPLGELGMLFRQLLIIVIQPSSGAA